ncbi:MAG: LysE family translocator [Gammaproteobacteria bacterium]|nr:LysE family translocator [Gammaproteobacteria bacterium]
MPEATVLVTIGGIYLVAAASPGPSFVLVSRLSMNGPAEYAVAAAVGTALGTTSWALLAMLGAAALVERFAWVDRLVHVLAAIYLVHLGLRTLRGAVRVVAAGETGPREFSAAWQALRAGWLTSLANPKSLLFWAGIFTTTIPAHAPRELRAAAIATIAILSAVWYSGLALTLRLGPMRAGYQRRRTLLFGVFGTLLVVLGIAVAFVV